MDDTGKSNRGLGSPKVSPEERTRIARKGGLARGKQLRKRAQNGSSDNS